MINRLNQWLSIKLAKRPGTIVLGSILLFNIVFFFVSVLIIRNFNLKGTEEYGFFQAAYLTITMILDAGCISYVIEDIGKAGVATAITCLVIIFIGMISFTGAVIGYITNYISNFLERANSGYRKLDISNHTVILNWNTRASEIINDLLFCEKNQNVAVLVSRGKDSIEKEIEERLSDTIQFYNRKRKSAKNVRKLSKVNVVVREGDVFSSKQLNDISLDKAKTVIILGSDVNTSACKFENYERLEAKDRGNTLTVKTLMQVAEITGSLSSADGQKIVVEITDDWTDQLVEEVIKSKKVAGKCNIVPVKVNQILGQLLSQFSITPELNQIYSEMFSNQGATFYSKETDCRDEKEFIKGYLSNHKRAIPLAVSESQGKMFEFYSADSEESIKSECNCISTSKTVKLNKKYWLEKRHVIILGHNSNMKYIVKGFASFCDEWNREDESILEVVVVDDKSNLEKMDYYRNCSFVKKIVECDVYDKEIICSEINQFVSEHVEDTSILILSDDKAASEDIDANALANLIYVQDIINGKKKYDPSFDPTSMDVIVELIDPKHHDIVNNYSGYNVVISNRYVSKIITQVGEKDSLFDFFRDILSFDEKLEGVEEYSSKEVYAKKVCNYFSEIPESMTATELIRSVFDASCDKYINNMAMVLGYVSKDGTVHIFEGNQDNVSVNLDPQDKLIVFASH